MPEGGGGERLNTPQLRLTNAGGREGTREKLRHTRPRHEHTIGMSLTHRLRAFYYRSLTDVYDCSRICLVPLAANDHRGACQRHAPNPRPKRIEVCSRHRSRRLSTVIWGQRCHRSHGPYNRGALQANLSSVYRSPKTNLHDRRLGATKGGQLQTLEDLTV